MDLTEHFRLMAQYNQWMNERIHSAAKSLSPNTLWENKGAFFGSLMGTANHLVVGDLIWLDRFSRHPSRFSALNALSSYPEPSALDQVLYRDLVDWAQARQGLDLIILDWVSQISDSDLDQPLVYHNMRGVEARKRFGDLVSHFFNHQTHHRGQISTLLSQEGVDLGVTDLLALIPNESP